MSIKFVSLFENPDKIYQNEWKGKIKSIVELGEIIEVSLLDENNILYKGLTLNKSEIFPTPKKDHILLIDKVQYKYDENFNLRFFINAKILNLKEDKNKNFKEICELAKKAISKIYEYKQIFEGKKTVDDFEINESNTSENEPLDESKEQNYIEDVIEYTFDFSTGNIIKNLKNNLKINKELLTNLFIIIDSTDDYYSLKCFENNEVYSLMKNNNYLGNLNFSKNDILIINDYYSEKDTNIIEPTKITIFEKLTEENLFFILQKYDKINEKYLWGKIIYIDENNKSLIIMDNKTIIYEIKNIKEDIKLGQFFFFSNYKIIDKTENEIALDKNAFTYFSSQDIYFSKKINLNQYSVIQFYFKDFQKDNIYNVIKIDSEMKNITNKKLNFVIKRQKIKNQEIYLQDIVMLQHKNDVIDKRFAVSILQGFMKKINIFINYKNDNSYYYEYLYYSFYKTDFLKTKNIKIDNNDYSIDIYDNYSSVNRRQFNIMNIPFQNECDKKKINKANSLLISETFSKNKKSNIYGIYNINEIFSIFPPLILNNDMYNKYYDVFGNIIDYLYNNYKSVEENEKQNFVNECLIKLEKYFKELYIINFLSNTIYDENITLSQLKTRLGIIASYYLYIIKNKKFENIEEEKEGREEKEEKEGQEKKEEKEEKEEKEVKEEKEEEEEEEEEDQEEDEEKEGQEKKEEKEDQEEEEEEDQEEDEEPIEALISIISSIIKKKEYLSYNQILRIFITLTRRRIINEKIPHLLILEPKNSKYSHYYLAQKFNLEEIKYMNEYSRFFQGYLQMDSFILYNYNLEDMSYSFSIEPIFILKKHLSSNYESFLILQKEDNDIIAWTESDVQITTINTKNLFGREQLITSLKILDKKKIKKGKTFGVSIVFRHEKNSHQKKNFKNKNIPSPINFCDNGKNKKITNKGEKSGEDGIIIESFLTKNREIITSLAKDFIYGELLDYHLFIGNNFKVLKRKIKKIMKENKKYFESFPIKNKNFKHSTIDKMKEFKINKDGDVTKEDVLNAIKYDEVRIGCQVYTISMIKDMISLAIELNRYDYLPTIVKKIDEEKFKLKK